MTYNVILCVLVSSIRLMSWPGGQYAAGGQPDPNLLRLLQQSIAGMVPMNPAAPQPPTPPPAAPPVVDNAMQMLLARAMSIPLATVLFQSLVGTQQTPATPSVFQTPPPVVQPPVPPAPQSQSPLMHMMQQAVHAAVAAQPQVTITPPPPPAQHMPVPPAALSPLSIPASAASGSPASPSIQLPPMDPSVAKDLLLQLVQQLQQAGQLPYDDSIQRLLQTNANAVGQQAAEVVVKKEPVPPDQSPICVISKTESFDEQKPRPEVYMDVADQSARDSVSAGSSVSRDLDSDNDDGCSDEPIAHSSRTARTRQTGTARGKRQKSPPKPVPRTTRTLAATSADPKLKTKCMVRLDKVDGGRKLASASTASSASQLSRVDRLKNMKKYNVSTDILHSSKGPEPRHSTPTAASTSGSGAGGSSSKVEPVERKPVMQQKMPLTLQPVASSSRSGNKNIFSIFAQHPIGRNVPEEPVVEVRPSDPLPPTVGVLLQRSVNCATNPTMSVRSMYLGYASHNMEWLSLVSSTFAGNRKTFCQCTFCPKLGEFPRDVALHISREHQDLLFALNKLKPLGGPVIYIKCRHCNFITVESTLAWIHFDIHHGISDILDCSDQATQIVITGPDQPERFIDIDEVMGPNTAHVCFDCSAVNTDADTNASALLMACHVARQHPNSINCNGNFVKLMMLTRNEGDPDSIKGSPTYRQAITETRHARGRREVYICMFCR